MISEQIGDGYSRLNGPSEVNPDMCAYVGDRITFKCTLVGKGEVTAPLITSPEGTVLITGLVIEAFVDIEQHTASGGYDCSFSTVSTNLSAFLGESLKMKELCHPNVMNLLGVSLDAGPTPYIVLPFMENGDLLSYIKKHRESLLATECDDIDKVHL